MSRIILVGNYPPDGSASMLGYGRALHLALRQLGADVHLWQPPTLLARWSGRGRGWLAKWLGYVDCFVLGLPALLLLRLRSPDAVWHVLDQGNACYALILPDRRTLATAHDLFAIRDMLRGRLGATGRLLQRLNLRGLRAAARIIAVSPATAEDLRRLRFPVERLVVVANALRRDFGPMPAKTARELLCHRGIPTDQPFLFHLGGNQWYKNRRGAVSVFTALRRLQPSVRWRLILAGKPWTTALAEAVAACPQAADIHDAGEVDDEILTACYSLAEAVVVPSLAEGFGWPVAEAQACGAVVVASDRQPLPFVGGDGARYADPLDPAAFARTVLEAIAQRDSLRSSALVNIARFDCRAWAERIRACYALRGACGRRSRWSASP